MSWEFTLYERKDALSWKKMDCGVRCMLHRHLWQNKCRHLLVGLVTEFNVVNKDWQSWTSPLWNRYGVYPFSQGFVLLFLLNIPLPHPVTPYRFPLVSKLAPDRHCLQISFRCSSKSELLDESWNVCVFLACHLLHLALCKILDLKPFWTLLTHACQFSVD